jgi:hypothetical protein
VLLRELYEAKAWAATLADDETTAMIIAGDTVCVGGAGKIRVFDRADGREAKPALTVRGTVHELSAAGGSLYAGTDAGYVYCFNKNGSLSPVDEDPPRYTSLYPTDDALAPLYAEAAHLAAAAASSNQRGFCVVIGSREGRLAYAVSQRRVSPESCRLGSIPA